MSKSIEGNFSLVGGKIVKEEVTRASETTKKEYQSDYSGSGVGTQFMRSTFQSQSDEFQIEDSYGKSSFVESKNVIKKRFDSQRQTSKRVGQLLLEQLPVF